MSERRDFMKLVAAGPAAALLLPLFAETGPRTLAAEVEANADALGKLPSNIIYTHSDPGVWKGKDGGHVPKLKAERDADGKLKVAIETPHPMSEPHFIVRHTLVSGDGEVLGAKTFTWKDKPNSEYSIDVPKGKPVYVLSFCNRHDLWMAHSKIDA